MFCFCGVSRVANSRSCCSEEGGVHACGFAFVTLFPFEWLSGVAVVVALYIGFRVRIVRVFAWLSWCVCLRCLCHLLIKCAATIMCVCMYLYNIPESFDICPIPYYVFQLGDVSICLYNL